MVFHSYLFLFLFLPVVLSLYWLIGHWKRPTYKVTLIAAAGIVFYASWGMHFLPFILGSAVINYSLSRWIFRLKKSGRTKLATQVMATGIALNVVFLMLIKYQAGLAEIFGISSEITGQYFPIGISFVTFIQIIYLFESYVHADRHETAMTYLAFSTFFPFVTSGPIVSARDTMSQIAKSERQPLSFEDVTAALALFSIGLFKKLVIADSLAPYADKAFGAAGAATVLSTLDAWTGAITYSFQLYFDFSGYCDMAVALGFLLGVRLPLNFNSPFKSLNVAEFWQRWHMTLTRFITNYLYFPVATRLARASRTIEREQVHFFVATAIPILLVFLVAGAWHGTGWTFVIYGLYWGVVLSLYYWVSSLGEIRLPSVVSRGITMLVVLFALVIFRSDSMDSLSYMLRSMFSLTFTPESILDTPLLFILIFVTIITFWFPNSQQIAGSPNLTLDAIEPLTYQWHQRLVWRPTTVGAILLGGILITSVLVGGGSSSFLYYKF